MKNTTSLVPVLLLVFPLFALAEETVTFTDPVFERALRDAMDIHDRPITQKDAYTVHEIGIHNDKSEGSMFTDIAPMQCFVNLKLLGFNSKLSAAITIHSQERFFDVYLLYGAGSRRQRRVCPV